jgi:hypothetical protein
MPVRDASRFCLGPGLSIRKIGVQPSSAASIGGPVRLGQIQKANSNTLPNLISTTVQPRHSLSSGVNVGQRKGEPGRARTMIATTAQQWARGKWEMEKISNTRRELHSLEKKCKCGAQVCPQCDTFKVITLPSVHLARFASTVIRLVGFLVDGPCVQASTCPQMPSRFHVGQLAC